MAEFTDYDAVITDGATSLNLIEYEADTQTALFRGIQQKTDLLPPRPPRQDVPNLTNFEQSPAYGDLYGQGDFSGGMYQRRYHAPGRDPKKYLWSDGIDISDPGRLQLLHATALAVSSSTIGRDVEVANGLPFVIDNTGSARVKRGDGAFPGTWTAEDPGGGATASDALTSSGDELFAAQSHIYRRNSAGTWSLFTTKASANVDRVAYLKGRLICSDGLSIYEVTASGGTLGTTYIALETLPPGNRFEAIFEYGEFIYACVINTTNDHSSIHHYGLNQNVTAIEKKGETDMPRGQLAYSGASYMGVGYIGVGVRSARWGGLNPIVYQCAADARGFLTIVKLAESVPGSTRNHPVAAFEPYGNSMYMGWPETSIAPGFNDRVGLAVHDLSRDAFANHLNSGISTVNALSDVSSIKVYKGRLMFVVRNLPGGGGTGAGLYYEDTGNFVGGGQLWTSVLDFNSAGNKIWDTFEAAYEALLASQEVQVYYSLSPDTDTGAAAIDDTTVGSTGQTVTITTNLKSRTLSLRLIFNPAGALSTTPIIKNVSVRSNPSPTVQEFMLTRYYRVLTPDRKDSTSQEVRVLPDTVRSQLEAMANRWVTFQEPNKTWTALVVGVSDVSPMADDVRVSGGDDPTKKAYVMQVQMIAR